MEHSVKVLIGLVVVITGTVMQNTHLGALGLLVNLIGGTLLLIGIVGAGVHAGNRAVVEELQRAFPPVPLSTDDARDEAPAARR